ncbi:SGNH/GDSL hydrolase family protein [Bradyrhizobium sp. Arg237L]|uniref:SGNH/GDSL hydrolase family protein n=1 Tax=Bradyrhizobium sp. Arg237L TaxID=3003352 RepID=UPI00249E6345|nr:SGNH/GDSL hydrolase family protein [Bradyrhizobium sp. Arg237L]MDI4239483.1 SGNH/GDSL hydrolase family protein [Bradyrhizobium sp. Arg237L]
MINLGANDYLHYLQSSLPKDPSTAQTVIGNVIATISGAINELTQAGVDKVVLYTLPDPAHAPLFSQLPPAVAEFTHQLILLNNAALEQLVSTHPNIQLVDQNALFETVASDPASFGFSAGLSTELINLTHSTAFAPNEVLFFDAEHPTYAGHGVLAAFSDTVLTSDHTQILDGTQPVVHVGNGSNFIFATPIDHTNPDLNDAYTIFGGSGSSIIYAGEGNVTVHGGSGNELIAAGHGNADLDGGNGDDLLATNSSGVNSLDGGNGTDALIANRAGTNTIEGGGGDDLIVLKENTSLLASDGTFNFGAQTIDGGNGHDTLRFVINDQNPVAEAAFMAEFKKIEAAFDGADHHAGTLQVGGLDIRSIERLELQIDSVSKDRSTPFLITHTIAASDGAVDHDHGHVQLSQMLHTAENFGWLTV